MNYTKGPWKAEGNSVFKDEWRNPIATSYDPDYTNQLNDVSKANAQLISAAPEMYEALRWLVNDLPKNRDWLSPDLEKLMKQALAKAEGKEG